MGAGSCHWECLNLRYPSFQWTLLLVLMCQVGILFLFCYLALVTPISGSVINLCYPFSDFTIHSVHKRVSVNNLQLFYDRRTVFSPKTSKDYHESFPTRCLNASVHQSCFFVGRALFPLPVLWETGFCCFLLAQSRTEVFSWENFVAKTVLEFSFLRNLSRNVECRRLNH